MRARRPLFVALLAVPLLLSSEAGAAVKKHVLTPLGKPNAGVLRVSAASKLRRHLTFSLSGVDRRDVSSARLELFVYRGTKRRLRVHVAHRGEVHLVARSVARSGRWVHVDVTRSVRNGGRVVFILATTSSRAILVCGRGSTSCNPQLVVETRSKHDKKPPPPPPPSPPPSPPPPPPAPAPACSDGLDNDGDLLVDYPADPGCTGATDTDEANSSSQPGNGSSRWYSTGSPWNTLVGSSPAFASNSDALVQKLVATGKTTININHSAWTIPVFHASASTPKYNLKINCTSGPNAGTCWNHIDGVPIPSNAVQDAQTDAEIMILDDSTGCEYDFWSFSRQTDGSYYAGWEQTERVDQSGFRKYDVRAGFSALGAGLIRPEEIQAGRIDHALALFIPNTDDNVVVLPAQGTDGRTADGIPMGTHFQLNPSFDISALPASEKVIAQALKDYGAYVMDSGGAVGLSAQHEVSINGSWPLDWDNGLDQGLAIMKNFRVIAPPTVVYNDDAAGCAQNTHY